MLQRKTTNKLCRTMVYTNPPEPIAVMTIDGHYKTLTFYTMKLMHAWYEYVSTHEKVLRFMQSIRVNKFVCLNWDNKDHAPPPCP